MQYIVLDMEWNQPWPGSPSAEKGSAEPLRGEIVQIRRGSHAAPTAMSPTSFDADPSGLL